MCEDSRLDGDWLVEPQPFRAPDEPHRPMAALVDEASWNEEIRCSRLETANNAVFQRFFWIKAFNHRTDLITDEGGDLGCSTYIVSKRKSLSERFAHLEVGSRPNVATGFDPMNKVLMDLVCPWRLFLPCFDQNSHESSFDSSHSSMFCDCSGLGAS